MWLLWYMPEMFPGKNRQKELTKFWFFSSGWKYFPVNPGIKDIIQRYYCPSELKNAPNSVLKFSMSAMPVWQFVFLILGMK